MKRPALVALLFLSCAWGSDPSQTRHLRLIAGRSVVIESATPVKRVAVASGETVEAVAVSDREVLLNGKSAGETTVTIWSREGADRQVYEVAVELPGNRLDALRERLRSEVGDKVQLDLDDKSAVLRGIVQNQADAERAVALAATAGKPVNLLKVAVPATDPQILLKVRFADLDRAASTELGANLISTGAANTPGSISTQQFSPPTPRVFEGRNASFNVTDALNIFLFRPDLNLGATIRALQAKHLVEILAEPNVLAMAGEEASFLAGGEFPYPVVQNGGNGYNTVTIQFREFGVRIRFRPVITRRGTIRLRVAPEVSSLDYANGLVYQGFNIPGLAVRRVQTEIELQNQQSFAIAGLLDNRVTESFNRVPGLSSVPFFGRLFQSRSMDRSKSELLIVVTPELVQPIPAGTAPPSIDMPREFLKDGARTVPGNNPPATAKPAVTAAAPAVSAGASVIPGRGESR